MNRQEERIKAAFVAYPENKMYSTIDDTIHDYNLRDRKIWLNGAEWSDEHPKNGLVDIDKVCAFLEKYMRHYHLDLPTANHLIFELRRSMEE